MAEPQILPEHNLVLYLQVERAKIACLESVGLEAVGLSAPAVAHSQTGILTIMTGERLKTTTKVASDRIQEISVGMWAAKRFLRADR